MGGDVRMGGRAPWLLGGTDAPDHIHCTEYITIENRTVNYVYTTNIMPFRLK